MGSLRPPHAASRVCVFLFHRGQPFLRSGCGLGIWQWLRPWVKRGVGHSDGLFPNMQRSQRQARCKHSSYDRKKELVFIFVGSWCKKARDGIKKRKYDLGAAAAQSLHLVVLFSFFLLFPLQLRARIKLEPSRRFQIRFGHLRF